MGGRKICIDLSMGEQSTPLNNNKKGGGAGGGRILIEITKKGKG